ncbi:hypothetical protein [Cellulomonas oligotrophica]|uniref:Uncharacterized protein n=1 Tax=Cellulomonas oligotrophica TaxID=931536 RepID=A0ABQ4D5V6_9CELL|nr:hypothetical protein [Cellulomonas oligotrophica]GIG30843.1 hypothetical protein Col01nite_00020 [Cellulomonas oligotrophica]
MKYVQLKGEDGGVMLDARRYLEVLPEMVDRLPEGARRFATDPDRYDFYSTRCVKDLVLDRQVFDVDSETCVLVFTPNLHKHDDGLTVTYIDVRSIEVQMEPPSGFDPMRFHVLLDEILPTEDGVRHEYGLRRGTVVIRAADLEARWGTVE